MRVVNIPGTTLYPSVLALGTNRLGSLLDRDHSFALLDAFAELGGTFIDTAHIYADWIAGAPPSASEKTIGAWMAARNCRAEVVLATKCGHPDLRTPQISRLSARDLLADLSQSLEFLRTDHVDLLWLHRDDPALPVGEIVEAINQVIGTGQTRYVGCSNWRSARIRAANLYAQMHGLHGFVASQPQWSLAVPNRSALSDPKRLVVFRPLDHDFHRETGMAVIPYSTQAQGFFDKLERLGMASLADKDYRGYYSAANAALLPRVKELAARHGVSINALALSYLMSHAFAVFPIVGPRTVVQLRDSASAADVILSPEELAQLT